MISYVGGKYRQAKWISQFLPNKIDTYAEVFGGAMWVYLRSNFFAEKVYYNDVNPFMANLFSCCKHYDEFLGHLKSVKSQDQKVFDEYKKEVNELFDSGFNELYNFDVAKKYVYIATQVFSGIIKNKSKMVDLKGKYKSKYDVLIGRLEDTEIQEKISKIIPSCKTYEDFIPSVDHPETHLYLDPPYYNTENLYGFHDFNKDSHEHLLNILKKIESQWILSYYEFDILKEMLPEDEYKWERKDYKKASMASKGKSQTVGTEVLVLSKDL